METKAIPFSTSEILKVLARTLATETKLAKKIVSCIPGFEEPQIYSLSQSIQW